MIQPYLTSQEVQAAIGGTRTTRMDDYDRAVAAATQKIDRWTGRRFLQDAVASTRLFRAWDCDRVCIGDYTDPTDVVVETDDIGDGTWSVWDPSEWQPEADDRGNGRFVRLDGEPWRWIGTTGTRKFPTCGRLPRVRATTRWGWTETPYPVRSSCLKLAIHYFEPKARDPQPHDGDPTMVARDLVFDYAVEGGTLCLDPLAP